MAASEAELLHRARTGDRAALSDLLLLHGSAIRDGLDINPKWRSVLEVDDVLQVTYFEVFEQIDQFDGDERAFPNWLRRIAQNNLRDAIHWLKREKRPQPEMRITAPSGSNGVAWLYELVAGGGTSPSHHAARNEMRRMLESEIEALPHDYGLVLRRIFLEGDSVGEVAEEMGRSRGAVHLLRIRAVDRLRARLGSGSQFFSYHG